MKYEAVIFDLFGPLVYDNPSQRNEDVIRRMAAVLSTSSDEFLQLWHNTLEKRMTGIFKIYGDCFVPADSHYSKHVKG